jgi:hypothetical protein
MLQEAWSQARYAANTVLWYFHELLAALGSRPQLLLDMPNGQNPDLSTSTVSTHGNQYTLPTILTMLCATFLASASIFSHVNIVLGTNVSPLPIQSRQKDYPGIDSHEKHGAVASESSICSNIGIDLMRKGGNAADAVC